MKVSDGAVFVTGSNAAPSDSTFLFSGTAVAGATSDLSLNGSTSGSGAAPSVTFSANFLLGAADPDTGDPFLGTLNEIVFYNVLPSAPDRRRIEGYLAWKWGFVGSLPVTHPYRQMSVNPIVNPTIRLAPTLSVFRSTTM